jgi:hypothetical protein
MVHEILRRFVEQRPPRNFCSAGNLYQAAIEERLEDAIHSDAADGFDISACDRLPVSDDRQSLHRGGAQPGRTVFRKKLSEPRRKLRFGHQLPAGSGLAQFISARWVGALGSQLNDGAAENLATLGSAFSISAALFKMP